MVAIIATAGQALGRQNLHVVPSPFINYSSLSGTVALGDNDIWAAGDVTGGSPSDVITLAEHFDGRSWSVVATPSISGGASLSGVDGVASNDVWAVGD